MAVGSPGGTGGWSFSQPSWLVAHFTALSEAQKTEQNLARVDWMQRPSFFLAVAACTCTPVKKGAHTYPLSVEMRYGTKA